MVSRGDDAPSFDLPAIVDGDVDHISLDDYLAEDIIILAFYPGDFNPACTDETADLGDLNLFTMQKDISIVAISGDSVYSHRAFAETYDLQIPLLSDVRGEVATAYGVNVEDPDAGYGTRRAIVIVAPDGTVTYKWETDNQREVPDISVIRSEINDVGGDADARGRYRVGHAHYAEGRRAFTSAMHELEESEWMMAEHDFKTANEEFREARDIFNTAVRFSEDETEQAYYESAEDKSAALWQASEWLAQAANAYASGEGAEAERLRRDAESPLEEARDIHEPPDPDDFPPEEPPPDPDESDTGADDRPFVPPDDETERDVSLDVDLDAEEATASAGTGESETETIREELQESEAETIREEMGESKDQEEIAFGQTDSKNVHERETESERVHQRAEGKSDENERESTNVHGSESETRGESGGDQQFQKTRRDSDDSAESESEEIHDESEEIDESDGEEIDEGELEEITAELKAQTEKAQEESDEASEDGGEESFVPSEVDGEFELNDPQAEETTDEETETEDS